jgi:hypothetical protein
VIPIGAVLFIAAQLLSLPEALRAGEAREREGDEREGADHERERADHERERVSDSRERASDAARSLDEGRS